MSVYDLFRGFFGLPGGRRPRDPFFGGITREDEDEDDDEDGDRLFGAGHADGFGFGFPFGSGGMHFYGSFGCDELFRDFDDLFNGMGAWAEPSRPFEFPGMEALPPTDGSREKRGNLRDSMLKYPESHQPSRALEDGLGPTVPERRPWHPFRGLGEIESAPVDLKDSPKEDRDLDLHVTSEGLEGILPPGQPRSYYKSVSVTKVVAPDGTVEERRTVRDSQGHEETTVTRRSLESVQPDSSGELAPFSSCHREDISGSAFILDTFRRWFSSWFLQGLPL